MINAYAALAPHQALQPFQYKAGALGAHEVDIKVSYCGICHSDLSMLNNEWGMTQYPFVPGHEVVGTIAAVGEQITHLTVGQIVGLGWHSNYCHHCSACMSGDQNLCNSAQATIVGRHGGFADHVRADASAVIPLPEGMDIATAGPLFCGGITVFNPLVQFGIKPTDKVAVIGIGGLGHLAVQFLHAWGCEVTAFTSSASKIQEALDLGADHTLDSRNPEALQAATGRFDFIISTVNVKLDWSLYMSTLKPKGRLHFVGATLEPLNISAFSLIMGQRSISGSPVGSPATMAQMLEFAKQHQIQPVAEFYEFKDVNAAIERLASGQARYRVILKH